MNDMIKDEINYFIEQADKLHINYYFLHSKDDLIKYIDNYLNDNKINNKYDLIYMFKCINKYMLDKYDSHSTIVDNDNILLPLNFKYIDNELYIDNCFDKKFIKAKVISINKINIDDIISSLEKIVCYGTKEWFNRCVEIELTRSTTLLSLPSIDSDSKIFDFETDKGLLIIDVNKKYSLINNNDFKYKVVGNTLIYKYSMCIEKNVPDLEYIKSLIKDNNIDNFALDIRNNPGGNQTLLLPLVEFLKNSNINTYTIVNKGVISSARWVCIDMKNIGSVIISEDQNIGTPLNCFGSNNKSMVSPNYGLLFVFSKWFISYEDNKIIPYKTKEDFNNLNKELLNPIYLKIDKYIPLTKEDYFNDVDIIDKYFYK